MRSIAYIIVVLALIFGYAYIQSQNVCNIPLSYRIGSIDERFGLSFDTAHSALRDAEKLWEDTLGQDLFIYDENATFLVNFIYDERQELTDKEQQLKDALDVQNDLNQTIREEYEAKSVVYEARKEVYEKTQAAYARDIGIYNKNVAMWNDRGGAPEKVYEELNIEQTHLESEWKKLESMVAELNARADELNALGEQGDALVNRYNSVVESYNSNFDVEREFTQGDYQGENINIYEYETTEELRIVLAHEFGHALSLGHVEGENSVMYHLMGTQIFENGLSAEDLAAFDAQCGEKNFFSFEYLERFLKGW